MNRKMTPIEIHNPTWGRSIAVGNGIGVAGTFNGTTYTAAVKHNTADSIGSRHHFIRFTDAASTAAVFQFTMNKRYITDGNITFDINWTTPSSTTGNAYLTFGLSQKGADNIIGNDTDTEYIAVATYAGPTLTNQVIKTTVTFDASLHGGISKDHEVVLIIGRIGANGADTVNQSVLLTGIDIRYKIDSLGTKTI